MKPKETELHIDDGNGGFFPIKVRCTRCRDYLVRLSRWEFVEQLNKSYATFGCNTCDKTTVEVIKDWKGIEHAAAELARAKTERLGQRVSEEAARRSVQA